MNVFFFSIPLSLNQFWSYHFFISTTNFQRSWLEICAIWARNQLSIRVIPWEPGFEIVFLWGRIVKSPRHNIYNSVWQFQRLIKFLRCFNHLLLHFPRFFRGCDNKLLNFLKLVNSKDSPSVFPVCSGFFSEAARHT